MPPRHALWPAPPTTPAPSAAPAPPAQLVEHFFRHETGRLHATLLRLLGVANFALAEDVAQEAMLRALRHWAMGGVPANPSAWITRVALNLARDALRHGRMAGGKEPAILAHLAQLQPAPAAPGDPAREIRDDTLRLLFVCCHPAIAPDAQVVLALKVLCGFGTAEIARAFLRSEAAIEKQLTRTKRRIQEAALGFEIPDGENLAPRLDGVLAALYLLFNEGYKASAGGRLLRAELCQEAYRLATLLVRHPAGDQPRTHALLALMLLSAARFPARQDTRGELLPLPEQDRARWDQTLIARGLTELAASAHGRELSEYHLQAGIAALHSTAADYAATDWGRILRHYDELARLKPSPVVALNRAVAVAHVHGARAGLDALAAIPRRARFDSHYLLHAVTGELHWRLHDHAAAATSFRRALLLARVGPEQTYLSHLLARSADPPVPGPTAASDRPAAPGNRGAPGDRPFGLVENFSQPLLKTKNL
ncbi:MAG: sigma-70 family RNA polymerase sigma factor [Opitutae bacterium]|nr:sigma-70 family RNA polymerase sigma factor [Opitutae bacterium]